MEKPTSVAILGWGWLAVGGLGLLFSLVNLVPAAPSVQSNPDWFAEGPLFTWLAGGSLILQGLAAGLGAAGGWYLMQGQSWSRTTLEILSWLTLADLIVGALDPVFGLWTIDSIARSDPESALGSGLLALPLATSLYYLRSDDVRAFARDYTYPLTFTTNLPQKQPLRVDLGDDALVIRCEGVDFWRRFWSDAREQMVLPVVMSVVFAGLVHLIWADPLITLLACVGFFAYMGGLMSFIVYRGAREVSVPRELRLTPEGATVTIGEDEQKGCDFDDIHVLQYHDGELTLLTEEAMPVIGHDVSEENARRAERAFDEAIEAFE